MSGLTRRLLKLAVVVFACDLWLVFLLVALVLGPCAWVVGILLVAAGLRARRGRPVLISHGSASFASIPELEQARMLSADSGLLLGRVADDSSWPAGRGIAALWDPRLGDAEAGREFFAALGRRRRPGPLVRLPQAVNTVCFAPVGAGKSSGMVIPFLLTCDESCVVLDFKGELALAAATARRAMGQEVHILDPYGVVTGGRGLLFPSATHNPLDFIGKECPLAVDDGNDIAQALAVRTGDEKEGLHWIECSEEFISAAVATVVRYGTPGRRSLQEVADILASPQRLDLATRLMLESPAWGGVLARMGAKLLHFVDRERASVLTTCGRFLRFLSSPAMAAATGSSSFDPAGLKRRRMTVFIVLPPERMKAQMGWLRLTVGSMVRACVREGLGERRRVHFVLDEAASLGGQLDAVEDLVDKYRGYGCRAQFYYQSAGQLAKCWPKDQGQTLLSNSAKVFFAVADIQTANLVSSMLGRETIVVESGGTTSGWSLGRSSTSGGSSSTGSSASVSGGRNNGWQPQPRELLKPEEVLALHPRLAITFPGGGVPPVLTALVRYYEEPDLFRRPGGRRRERASWPALAGAAGFLALALAGAVVLASAVVAVAGHQNRRAVVPAYTVPPAHQPRSPARPSTGRVPRSVDPVKPPPPGWWQRPGG